jgi:NADH-quinone oxidoreductase subunit G
MPKLTINGTVIEVAAGMSVLQACEQLGLEIPRFCYHDKLSVAGNCRMCLVEVEKTPKPQASCALPCAEGMVVHTDSAAVKKARSSVMELLLINHPLDCPICDQGGECDLQDQAMGYGADRGKYAEERRAVADKELGPLVKTVMTRCIQCTRCIRFVDEICGTPVLGGLNRSEHLEIGTYIEQAVSSELSGNLVDICPVGALTNKPYAFSARPWELQKTDSIDVMDAVGSAIRIDTRGNTVLRILPRLHEAVNEDWINDKTRHAGDGLTKKRLDRPWLKVNGKLQPVSWDEALNAVAQKLQTASAQRVAALAGDLADAGAMLALKDLMLGLGVPHLDCRQDGAVYDTTARAGYIMNSGIAGIEQADVLLLIGTNPRHEGTMVNARIRKRWLQGGLTVGLIGEACDLTYPVRHLGSEIAQLEALAKGGGEFAEILRQAKFPMLILGADLLARPDGAVLQGLARQIAEIFAMVRQDWNGFNVLQQAASRVGGLDLGFLPQSGGMTTLEILAAARNGSLDVLYLLGVDELDLSDMPNSFVIYQGHHGDRGAQRADVILPAAAYSEKTALYVNTEGRAQWTRQASFPPGEAREDWKIIRALSGVMGKPLPYDSAAALQQVLMDRAPVWQQHDGVTPAAWQNFGKSGASHSEPLRLGRRNFYLTNPICRASPTLQQCATELWPLNDPHAKTRASA